MDNYGGDGSGGGDDGWSPRHVRFNNTKADYSISIFRLRLKLNILFKLKTSYWILHRDSATAKFAGEDPSSSHSASATVPVPDSYISCDKIHAAVGKAAGDLLTDAERRNLAATVWNGACEYFEGTGGVPKFGILNLDVSVLIEEREIVDTSDDDMVGSADSAVES